MSQPSVAAFFHTRKRVLAEDAASIKTRRLTETAEAITGDGITTTLGGASLKEDDIVSIKAAVAAAATANTVRTRSGRTTKRGGVQAPEGAPNKMAKIEQSDKQQQKLVKFVLKGSLSPHKKAKMSGASVPQTPKSANTSATVQIQKVNEETPSTQKLINNAFASKNNATNVDRGLKTPTKQIIKGSGSTPLKPASARELKTLVRKELNFDEVKTKITRSAKLQELKASLGRIQELERTRKGQEERNRRLREGTGRSVAPTSVNVIQLKQFDKIELELLTSPSKTFKTPTKAPPPTPDKNELMSPRHTDASKRLHFSPAKNGSPSKLIVPPAYQRFANLAATSKAGQLALPYKYRHLIEIFKALDSVCAMFHNRKECITFKKLKPAVQRMLRKNLTEKHLAQIRHLYPEAFLYTQMKMRNYGSTSKADYFQLVICPNVVENAPEKQRAGKVDEDNVLAAAQSNSMNPQVMTERMRRFQRILLQRVMDEHDKFLKSLDPPLIIPREKVTRWHPDFDLEKCADIECAHLPQPPNVEKYSSARDILSTARNLFNCATPMERAMERYEAKMESDRLIADGVEKQSNAIAGEKPVERQTKAPTKVTDATSTATPTIAPPAKAAPISDSTSVLLKGVPKSLLDKIRAKQAAKALDAMTRRPSQDQEATRYSRLPDLARHLRNVFITERKSVLTLEIVIKKIQNSFRACLTAQEVEDHLRLIAKEVPNWVAFHEVRKTMYLKIAKDLDLSKIIERLETVANEKSK